MGSHDEREPMAAGRPGFRNYSLAAGDRRRRFRAADWYSCPVPRTLLRQLMQPDDRIAYRSYGLWLTLLALSGTAGVLAWGTWYAVPIFLVYGVLYGAGGNSRWHEGAHSTPFRTRWLNEFFYLLASFMALKNPYAWRWSHSRHHTDTIVVGRDPEIAFPRPPNLWGMALNLVHLKTGPIELGKLLRHACGRISAEEADFLPDAERAKVIRVARLYLGVLAVAVSAAVLWETWLPVVLVGLPTFYGSGLHHVMSATQHAGMAEDVPDHRLTTRTVYLNPVLRFIYSNMNYHIEHHMFPKVPFYALPALHDAVRADMPPAYTGLWAAYRELIPALVRQRTDPTHFIRRPRPTGARQAG